MLRRNLGGGDLDRYPDPRPVQHDEQLIEDIGETLGPGQNEQESLTRKGQSPDIQHQLSDIERFEHRLSLL
jgi:hypothetical protein